MPLDWKAVSFDWVYWWTKNIGHFAKSAGMATTAITVLLPMNFWILAGGFNLSQISNIMPNRVDHNTCRQPSTNTYTLWLFNIAMENGSFIDDFPIKTSICNGFSMAMLNSQRVHILYICTISIHIQFVGATLLPIIFWPYSRCVNIHCAHPSPKMFHKYTSFPPKGLIFTSEGSLLSIPKLPSNCSGNLPPSPKGPAFCRTTICVDSTIMLIYPLVNLQKAIENGH